MSWRWNRTDDGYDFCLEALGGSDDAAILVQLSGKRETHWLEFKAACTAPDNEQAESSEVCWHLTKALIALANTAGGCLLLGVNDEAQPVGLAHSDPNDLIGKKGMDAFVRHLEDRLLQRKSWFGGRTLSQPIHDFCTLRVMRYQGVEVIAILVRAIVAGEPLIEIIETVQQKQRSSILVRSQGDVGRNKELVTDAERRSWNKVREKLRAEFPALPAARNYRRTRRVFIPVLTMAALALALFGWTLLSATKDDRLHQVEISVFGVTMEIRGDLQQLNEANVNKFAVHLVQKAREFNESTAEKPSLLRRFWPFGAAEEVRQVDMDGRVLTVIDLSPGVNLKLATADSLRPLQNTGSDQVRVAILSALNDKNFKIK